MGRFQDFKIPISDVKPIRSEEISYYHVAVAKLTFFLRLVNYFFRQPTCSAILKGHLSYFEEKNDMATVKRS